MSFFCKLASKEHPKIFEYGASIGKSIADCWKEAVTNTDVNLDCSITAIYLWTGVFLLGIYAIPGITIF